VPAQLDSASIVVQLIDARERRGYMPELAVHIDDVSWGMPPQRLRVPAGRHTAALFSQQAFQAGDKEDKERMQGAFVNLDCSPGTAATVEFTYKCDHGHNGRCDDNEWYFSSRILRNADATASIRAAIPAATPQSSAEQPTRPRRNGLGLAVFLIIAFAGALSIVIPLTVH